MEKKTDRRVRKTKAQLRAGLAKLMQTKSIKEITVKELVDEVDINRSTFYLHYTDIYQMLESIEDELEGEINQIVNNHPVDSYYKESFPMIKEILEVLWDNRYLQCPAWFKRRHGICASYGIYYFTTQPACSDYNICYRRNQY